ncbi:hypothetical protein [Aquitalea pelogenes]|uniref:hypothetical protein n=1 Tax=Aquitalea pelogenes TaxID=1293573 RepID=UPI0035B12B26
MQNVYAHATTEQLTLEALRNLDFDSRFVQYRYSVSPKEAFDERETGLEVDTLADYLQTAQGQVTAQYFLVSSGKQPSRLGKLRIYRALDQDSGEDALAILPGACVTLSKQSAFDYGQTYLPGKFSVFSSWAYADELVTYGNPDEFFYYPRSLESAYERYVADFERETQRRGR